MGDLCQTNVTPEVTHSTTVSDTDIPEWVSKGGQELFEQAKILAQEDFPLYGGPRVAGTTGDESRAFDLTRQNLGAYQPAMSDAMGLTSQAGQGWSQDVAETYMNPYQNLVTDIAADELRRYGDIRNRDIGAAAPQFGAFGSARHGVLEAENERNLTQEISKLYAKGQAAAYESAGQRFDSDRAAMLGAGAQSGALGQMQSSLGFQDADVLLRSGQVQRDQAQRNLDTAYADFLDEREWPYRQVNFATGVLKGTPFESKTLTEGAGTQLIQQPNTVSQIAGLGLSGAALQNAGFFGN
ncbi:MAG: hypothetical protein RIA64_01525 [Rhodospirillales bacterium]